jgi:hypothetical protein
MGNTESHRTSLRHGNHDVRGQSLRPHRSRPVLGGRKEPRFQAIERELSFPE